MTGTHGGRWDAPEPGGKGRRTAAHVVDDVSAALDAARRELMIAADAATEVLGRMRRDGGLDEVRARAAVAEQLQDQLRVTLGRAGDAAEVTVHRLRREGEQLRVLAGHPDRVREHLDAAVEFFAELDQISNGLGQAGGGEQDAGSAQVLQLRQSFPLIETAVAQVTAHLRDCQLGVDTVLESLTSVTQDLRAGTGQGLPVGVPARVTRIDERMSRVQDGVRSAGLTGEAGGQHAYAAAVVANEAGQRLRSAQQNVSAAGAGGYRSRPPQP